MPVPDFTAQADRGSISPAEIMQNLAESNATLHAHTHTYIHTSGHKAKLVKFFLTD